MKMSRGPTSTRAVGALVGKRDHTSPGFVVAECFLTDAEEFLRMGLCNND